MNIIPLRIHVPFPIVDLGYVTYKHSKVTKLSLPGYMLLVYISTGGRLGHHTMGECLAESGIDSQIMGIFSKELYKLIASHHMVDCSVEIDQDEDEFLKKMPMLPISSLRLTEKGRKLFRDQYVDDENSDTKRLRLYYSPVERMFTKKANVTDCNLFPADAFDSEKDYPNKDNVEDYLNSIKSSELKLEDQERVTEVYEFANKEIVYTNKLIQIDITPDGADFICEDGRYLEYLTDCFKTEWLDNIIASEYGRSSHMQLHEVPLVNLGKFNNLLTMGEIGSINSKGCRYLLGPDRLGIGSNGCGSILSAEAGIEICRNISPICDILTIGEKGDIFSYEPADIKINPNGIKGLAFHLRSVIEKTIEGETKDKIIAILEEAIHRSEGEKDIYDDIIWLYNQKDDKNIIINFIGNKLQRCRALSEKSDVLLLADSKMKGIKGWKDLFSSLTETFIDEVVSGAKLDDFKNRLDVAMDIAKIIGLKPGSLIRRMIENLPEDVPVEDIYIKLKELNMPDSSILSYANVVPVYVDKIVENRIGEIVGNHTLADDFRRLGYHLAELRDITGIGDDPVVFYPKKIENIANFKLLADLFIREENDIENNYRPYAETGFARLHQYYDAIVSINARLEGKSVADMTKDDFILLADTDRSQCLSNLSTRMEIELRTLLDLNPDAKELAKKCLMMQKTKDS